MTIRVGGMQIMQLEVCVHVCHGVCVCVSVHAYACVGGCACFIPWVYVTISG